MTEGLISSGADPKADPQGSSGRSQAGPPTTLAEAALRLQDTQAALRAFERHYLGRTQHLLAILEALRVKILEQMVQADPPNTILRGRLTQARTRAHAAGQDIPTGDTPAAWSRVEAPAPLKALYGRIAERLHPALTPEPAEAKARGRFLHELNAAYDRRDEARMTYVLVAWRSAEGSQADAACTADPHPPAGPTAHAALRQVEQELVVLEASDLGVLLADAQAAEAEERDLIGEVVNALRRDIDEARLSLARLRGASFL